MKQITDYKTLEQKINETDALLVYVMTTNCSVCHADYPKVKAIAESKGIEAVYINADEVPEAAGQLNLFTSPVVMLFNKGREYHRQARIIEFNALELRIEEVVEIAKLSGE